MVSELQLQSVIFKKKYWTPTKARAWLKNEGIKPIKKVHITDDYLRYRVKEQKYENYITRDMGNNVKFIMGVWKK